MNIPADLRYSSEHEWVRVEGDVATIGITAWAAEKLGDVVYVELPPEGVVVDVQVVERAADDPLLDEQLWEEVDEQQVPPKVRAALEANGLRTGQIGGHLPPTLANLVKEPASAPWPGYHLQRRAGTPIYIQTSDKYSCCSLLVNQAGVVEGRDFDDAQCFLRLTPQLGSDGRVRLHMLPELFHGPVRTRHVPNEEQSEWQYQQRREGTAYEALGWTLTLAPGEFALVTGVEAGRSSVGHRFFTASTPQGAVRRLVVIRASRPAETDPLREAVEKSALSSTVERLGATRMLREKRAEG